MQAARQCSTLGYFTKGGKWHAERYPSNTGGVYPRPFRSQHAIINSAKYIRSKKPFGSANGVRALQFLDSNRKIESADDFKFKANFGGKFTY